jgi:hypothetical protein
MPSLENYRELIRTIKSMGVDNVSPNDKKVLMDFLKTITFMGEFKILKECYDKDEDLKKIYPLLEVKINDLGSQINVLEGKLTETGNLSEFEKVKLRALKISYNRYVEIMKAITTRNFDHYVQFMNDKINNEEQIAAICSGVLDQADVDYAKVFIINGNEKSSLDIIYDLKNQQELLNELTTYFKRKKHYTVDNEEKIRQDEQFLNYLNLIKDNEALVRTFMKSVSIIGTAENDKEVIMQDKLSRAELELADLSKNLFSSLKNGKAIAELEANIEKYKDELEKIKVVKERFGRLLEQMADVNLLPIAQQFVSPTANIDDTVEQKVVTYVKSSMRNDSFDISKDQRKIEEEVRALNSQIVRKEELLDGSYNRLSSYGKELVHKYEDEVIHILDVVNGKVQGEVTPILAAYVLKALMDAKSLSASALTKVTNSSSKGMDSLVASSEAIVKNTIINIQEAINGVTNRAAFDVNELGAFHLR